MKVEKVNHIEFLKFKVFCFCELNQDRHILFTEIGEKYIFTNGALKKDVIQILKMLNWYFVDCHQALYNKGILIEYSELGNRMRRLFLDACEFHYYGIINPVLHKEQINFIS